MKRHHENMPVTVYEKRSRKELVSESGSINTQPMTTVNRTSKLDSPIMLLTGHESEINSCKFHPNGETLLSAGFDRNIFLWNTYGECQNYAMLSGGHKGAILDVHYSSAGDYIYSASTDKNLIIWDTKTGARIKKLTGHQNFVNACCPSRDQTKALLCSVSDDRTIRIWDTRKRQVASVIKEEYQLTSCIFTEASEQVIVGGIENVLKAYDLRKNNKLLYTMSGHFDTITGLSLSPNGNYALSNSMDNSLCIWDIRPFVQFDRCIKTLTGHQHNFEKNLLRCSWSPDGNRVTAGSADRNVYIWNVYDKRIIYKLPGHNGSINEVVFHPNEPIILSCSSDRQLFLDYCYTLCDSLLYNRYNPPDSRTNVPTPKSYGIDFDNLFIFTQDGIKIHMQFMKQSSSEKCPTLIYFHGNAGNIGHRLVNAIEFYQRLSCNILMVEYRGYGFSEGKPSERGFYKDALAAMKFLSNCQDIDTSKIILFGRSLGGAVAIGLAHHIATNSKYQYLKPSAMIIENTFTSVPDISRHLFSDNFNHIVLFGRFFRFIPDWFYKSRFNSIQKISNINLPTIFISGLSDELIPSKMMTRLFKRSSAVYKELHTFESGTHNFTWKCPIYYDIIGNFLKTIFENNVISNKNQKSPNIQQIDYKSIDFGLIKMNETIPLISEQSISDAMMVI